jgi:hypothetical protein
MTMHIAWASAGLVDPTATADAADVVDGLIESASLREPDTSGRMGAVLDAFDAIDSRPDDDPEEEPATV